MTTTWNKQENPLDFLLWHTCPAYMDGDVLVFRLDLCCMEAEIRASIVRDDDQVAYTVHNITLI